MIKYNIFELTHYVIVKGCYYPAWFVNRIEIFLIKRTIDNSEPASVRCSTDNLVLCQECDWDAHGTCSISASHERSPLEDFSGCPSLLELASIWGFDICGEKKALQPPAPPLPSTIWSSLDMLLSIDPLAYKSESAANTTLQELVVPSDNTLLYQHDPCADVYQQENGRKRK
ncbi:hypothetical protein NE237_032495 [Protea cynaroides]|uniref:Uncharacterized protein n=1 Tax=Protea cynaroides TaxID=273540 RepID=A0A9Q0R354_9MAGN|nr:hypothetical protein NE237_032495 [Protea cynaroides]